MTELTAIKLPPFSYYMANGKCYVRTYHNVRVPSKKDPSKTVPVKKNIKNVGVINDKDGIGPIIFYDEFIAAHPELNLGKLTVSRNLNQGQKRPNLQILPKEKGDVIRMPREVEVKSYGLHLVVKRILDKDPLVESLKFIFPDLWQECLALAEFMVAQPDARMINFELFQSTNETFTDRHLDGATISRLFKELSEKKIYEFFCDYFDRLEKGPFYNKERFWALDSTNFGCYGKDLNDLAWGRQKQDEDLPQLNVMMLVDQETERPLFYRHFNGSIPDVSTVQSMCQLAIQMGARSFVLVFDRGYYGKDNIGEIFDTGYHFVSCVPLNKTVQFDAEIKEAAPELLSGTHYSSYTRQNSICLEKDFEIRKGESRKLYVHVFYSPAAAGASIEHILQRRADVAQLMRNNKQLDAANAKFAKTYLTVSDDGKIMNNNSAFQAASNRAGFFVIISDTVKNSSVAYRAYLARSTVEEVFTGLKARMQMRRVRVCTEESLDGKCFIQFLAISIWMMLDHILDERRRKGIEVPHNSLPHVLKEIMAMSRVTFDGQYNTYTTVSRKQRECLNLFGVQPPDSGYKEEVALANQLQKAKKPN